MERENSLIVIYSDSVSITDRIATELADVLKAGDLLLLEGAIGTGKTTFIKALAKALGITEIVTSPSFVLHTLYESGRILLSHVDLYRLDDDEEIENIGFEDYYDDAITTVEWAERYSNFKPPYLIIRFEYGLKENERKITIIPRDGDWEQRLLVLR